MKNIILILTVFLLSVFNVTAQQPYFNTKAGQVLHYERFKTGAKKPFQTTRIEFDSVINTPDGQRIYHDMLVKKANGRANYGGHIAMISDINRQNDVSMDLGQTLTMIIKNYFPNVETRSEGTQAIMPAQMQPGDALPEAHAVVRAGSLIFTVDVTERTVLRTETITTPAGTFDCVVIREHKVEKGPMINHAKWSENWYSRGIGYVRHDNLDKNMQLEESEILVRIEQSHK